MAKKFFSIPKSNKKLREKTIQHLEHEGLVDSEEVLGGKQNGDEHNQVGWIKIEKSSQANLNFKDQKEISPWQFR